ncbi:survival motor neuron protein [Neodiprion virginianus]|uniref:survival motor neuron protein n=1 Tax=Neodiprion virginianus TaxID=2961670 RepID=UPI001EE70358|nr:survival motor neuron protein [Neodiprion virginianus]XP_046615778.1 survival motor neuron protein [Neodiprion virginianus]XP_046615779.1 survival motor neuron protein [Neodiprion virginianus]
MADEDNVLFVRKNSKQRSAVTDAIDDDWDDTALIKAYDKAVNLAKDEVARRMGVEAQSTSHGKQSKAHNHKPNRQTAKPYKKWVVGSPCRAVWSEDGEVYEAVIQKIYESSATCIVKFIGYENSAKVDISSLTESLGLGSQIAQTKEANAEKTSFIDIGESDSANNPEMINMASEDKMELDTDDQKLPKTNFTTGTSLGWPSGIVPPAPPLPPQLMTRLPESDGDALSSMLMSWYISGFHTGYYHGIKQAKENQERRKK